VSPALARSSSAAAVPAGAVSATAG
jgi:hypothetical protein